MIRFTRHSMERMRQRGISLRDVETIPQSELLEHGIQIQDQEYEYEKIMKKSILRIIFRIVDNDVLIITCIKSKK